MSIRGPLVADCEGVSAADHAAMCSARPPVGTDRFVPYSVVWRRVEFSCCSSIATFWVAARVLDGGYYTPPICPVCDPVGARKGDADAIAALASAMISAAPDIVARSIVDPEHGALASVLVALDREQEAGQLVLDARAQIDALRERVASLEAELADVKAQRRSVADSLAMATSGRFGGNR